MKLDYYKAQLIAAGADVSRPQYDIEALYNMFGGNAELMEYACSVLTAGVEFERQRALEKAKETAC